MCIYIYIYIYVASFRNSINNQTCLYTRGPQNACSGESVLLFIFFYSLNIFNVFAHVITVFLGLPRPLQKPNKLINYDWRRNICPTRCFSKLPPQTSSYI